MQTRIPRISLLALVGALVVPITLGQTNLITNPAFEDLDLDTFYGDSWGSFGNTGFYNIFGAPSACLFGDNAGNWGGVFQQGIPAGEYVTYQFDLLNARIESSWDADLLFGLEYYAADDATKLGETIVTIDAATRIANGQVDGNVLSMQGTAVAGTAFVRPIVLFENVNPAYASQADAGVFVFDTYLRYAPFPGDEYLKNAGFEDVDGDVLPGDYWSSYGAAGFNAFFDPNNAHASLFGDTLGNAGGIYQQAVVATPGASYRFDITNVRIEANFDADLYMAIEFYAADDATKLGEAVRQIGPGVTGDGLRFGVVGVAPENAVYARPLVRFENVQTAGEQRGVFIFDAAMTELAPYVNLLYNGGFEDLNGDVAYGDGWGNFGNTDFNSYWGQNGHASFYGDIFENEGGVFQLSIPGLPDETYQLDLLNTRIESNWDADLYAGFEFYAADDATKLGESLTLLDTATRVGAGRVDGNVFSVQGTAVAGTAVVRPIIRFDNVNPEYFFNEQTSTFVFDAFMSVAPRPGEQYLKNPAFFDLDGDGNFGDVWHAYGAAGFNEFFGANNPHASLFADTPGNTGGIYQQAILATPGALYRFDLQNVRIEADFDADLYFGLEFYGDDDGVKIGEAVELIDTSTTGDGLTFSMSGTAVAGAVYVRPIVFFDNVGTPGAQPNTFIFAAGLTEVTDLPGDFDGNGHGGHCGLRGPRQLPEWSGNGPGADAARDDPGLPRRL